MELPDCLGVERELPTVNVRLWRADAVVLFDWLMSTDLNLVPVEHPAQKQAPSALLSRLEWDVDADVAGATAAEIAAAKGAGGQEHGAQWACAAVAYPG